MAVDIRSLSLVSASMLKLTLLIRWDRSKVVELLVRSSFLRRTVEVKASYSISCMATKGNYFYTRHLVPPNIVEWLNAKGGTFKKKLCHEKKKLFRTKFVRRFPVILLLSDCSENSQRNLTSEIPVSDSSPNNFVNLRRYILRILDDSL